MRTLLRILAWNIAFLLGLVAAGIVAARARADDIVFGLPAVLAVWLLFQGQLFARRRVAVITCAILGGLLFLLQAAVLALILFWNLGFDATYPATSLQLLMGVDILAGGALIAWFLWVGRRHAG